MDAPLYNDWQFVSLSPFPPWALGLFAIILVLALGLSLTALSGETRRGRRLTLGLLRAVSACCLFALLLEPGLRLMQTSRAKNRVAVLIDRSASMALPAAPDGSTRFEKAKAIARASKPLFDELADNFIVELFTFGEALEPLPSLDALDAVPPTDGSSDLLGALEDAKKGKGAQASRKFSGAIVLTDGADNRRLNHAPDSRAKDALEALDAPITTVLVGEAGARDVSIDRVAVDDFAFVRNSLTITAFVRAPGFEGKELPVHLKVDGRVLTSRNLRVTGGETPMAVDFTFAPDRTGHFAYTVEIPPQEGEAIAANNALSFPLKVIRDRVRALHVAGRPSWDMRFLRGLLKDDPNIDLVSSYILRDLTDDPKTVSDGELSLIPFPMREIFHEQIHTFDVIFIQNFAHEERAYAMGQYLDSIADYVRGGGSLVMLGGENGFGEGHYERTVLQNILPVTPTSEPPLQDAFQARLTPQGRHHPITRIAGSDEASDSIWRALPPIAGAHVTRAKPGAQVILDHPFAAREGQNIPLVVLGEAGEGRVMTVLSDGTWQWAFSADEAFSNARLYERFWARAIRWLIRDPELTPVNLTLDKSALEPGEALAIQVEVRRRDYTPAKAAEIEIELTDASDGAVVMRERAMAGPEGILRRELTVDKPGPYKIRARGFEAGQSLGEDQSALAVHASGPEKSDAAVRPGLLEEIAQLTGGLFEDNPEHLSKAPLNDPEIVEIGQRRDEPLAHQAIFLAVIALCCAAEWVLRRRWGYP
ncbi:MAG: theronine dehydrogenase [Myxococcaceae bacterium]|nr:theronine dehydrogenase [Myxococcaceae bacterium]